MLYHLFSDISSLLSALWEFFSQVERRRVGTQRELHVRGISNERGAPGCSGKIETGIKTRRGTDEWDVHVDSGEGRD